MDIKKYFDEVASRWGDMQKTLFPNKVMEVAIVAANV